jgi:hypothetical protein
MLQSTPDMESMQSRLEAQERFWKSRLKQMEAAHERQLEGFRTQLDQVKGENQDLTMKRKSEFSRSA